MMAATTPTAVLDDAYRKEAEELTEALDTDAHSGLVGGEAERRLRETGPNSIGPPPRRSRWSMALSQFRGVVVLVLMAAATASALLGEVIEAAAIGTVVVLNAAIGFFTELRAQRALEQVQSETVDQARVTRDGVDRVIDVEDLVPGDLVVLDAGDIVPADLRIVSEEGLVINEASLTGESEGAAKDPAVLIGDVPLAERANSAFRGTTVQDGHGRGIVFATGAATEIGQIGILVEGVQDVDSPLARQLDRLGRALVVIVVILTMFVAVLGIARGLPTRQVVEVAIALGIAAVPEGLPAVTTLTLALGMLAMARRNALVRTLPSVESLGSTTVICTDKTGTLTAGEMTVQRYHLPGGPDVDVDGAGYEPTGTFSVDDPRLETALRIGVLCSDAVLDRNGDRWTVLGDPTEGALVVAGAKRDLDAGQLRRQFPDAGRVPFTSDRQWMATFHHQVPEGNGPIAYLKGAPRRLIERSTHLLGPGGDVRDIDDADRTQLLRANAALAEQGLRVLALAWREVDPPGEDVGSEWLDDLVLVALVGMADPPRPGVRDAIRECHKAGIRVAMITGDQPATAAAIARDLGLDPHGTYRVVHGSDLRRGETDGIDPTVLDATVFARVTPEDKLRIVEALQQKGEVVAVTGDGVNDAPALRQGDIGVAMGKRGTEAAKQVANMVLRDDDFTTIERAVAEGRRIYDNILKFGQFLFTWNLSEVLLVAGAIALGLPLPLLALQVLLLNIIVDLPPAYALAQEPVDPDVMARPPRDPRLPLLTPRYAGLIVADALTMAGAALGLYAWALTRMSPEQAQTLAFVAIALVQIPRIFACREQQTSLFGRHRPPNRLLWLTTIGMAAAVVLSVFVPGLSDVLQLTPPPGVAWIAVAVATAATVPLLELSRWVLRHTAGPNGRADAPRLEEPAAV